MDKLIMLRPKKELNCTKGALGALPVVALTKSFRNQEPWQTFSTTFILASQVGGFSNCTGAQAIIRTICYIEVPVVCP